MHCDTGVAEHGFRTGRRDDDKPTWHPLDGVAEMPQRTLGLAVVDLEVRDHGVHRRVPIDQSLVAIDQALAIKLHKHAANRRRQPRIHREAFAAPIGRGTEPAELAGDGAARLLFPLPNTCNELLAAELAL